MSGHHTNKYYITHHNQQAGAIERKATKQAARLEAYNAVKEQAEHDNLVRFAFCLLWFVLVTLIVTTNADCIFKLLCGKKLQLKYYY